MWKGFYFKENRFVAVKKIRVFEKVRQRSRGRGAKRGGWAEGTTNLTRATLWQSKS